jgi:hypothetical protein
MIKISSAIQNILEEQPFLEYGLHSKLFNLPALAKFIKPLIEARTKKEVHETAILMCLSRLQSKMVKKKNSYQKQKVVDVTIHSNLCSVTYYAGKEVFEKINGVYTKIKSQNGFISIIHGVRRITLIIEEKNFSMLGEHIKETPINVKNKIASVNIQLDENTADSPGQFFSLIQVITLQGINIREITSAFYDVMVFVDQVNVKLTFDTIYRYFCESER